MTMSGSPNTAEESCHGFGDVSLEVNRTNTYKMIAGSNENVIKGGITMERINRK